MENHLSGFTMRCELPLPEFMI